MIARVRTRLGLALAAALAATVLTAAPAVAGVYQQVLHVYEREGSIPACQFTSTQLQSALAGVDTYGAQYFADFTQAVQSALTARAGGACAPALPGAAAGINASVHLPPPPARALTAATSAGVPLPLVVLGGLAIVCGLTGAAVAVLRRGRRSVTR